MFTIMVARSMSNGVRVGAWGRRWVAIIGVTDNVHSNSALPLASPLKVDSTTY